MGHWKKRHLLTAMAFGVTFGGLGTYLLTPSSAQTATSMYLAPASANVTVGNNFSVAVRINAGESINAVAADLSYDSSKLQFVSIDATGSAFSTEAPSTGGSGSVSINRGQIGGVTGDKLVATVNFKALAASAATAVTFAGSSQSVRNADNTDALSAATGGSYALVVPVAVPSPVPSPTPATGTTPKPATPAPKTTTPGATPATPPAATPAPTPAPAATPSPAAQAPIPTTTTFEKEESSSSPLQVNTRKTGAKAALWGMAGLVAAAAVVAGTVFFRGRHAYAPVNHAFVMGDTPPPTAPILHNDVAPASTTVTPTEEKSDAPKDPPSGGLS
jgi:hypothetical protein